jgi:hypothetical protein
MPIDKEIDYRHYTRAELLEALASIDSLRYPQNYQHLVAEIASRDSGTSAEPPPPDRPSRVLRLLELRGDVTVTIGTKIIYGALGAFYFCMPLYVIFGLPKPIDQPGWAAAAPALVWMIAAFHLFGFCVKYKFESGTVKCLWFGRHLMWEDKLDTLQNVVSSVVGGLPTIYFVWPNHRRRLWLRMSDLDSANAIFERSRV